VVGAVHGRDRAAPEALARHQPVAQAVVDLALADALLLQPVDGPGLGGGDVEAVEELAVDLGRRRRCTPPPSPVRGAARCARSAAVGRGEVPVALVLGGHGHDGPGPVAHEHVVGHVDRHRLPVNGLMAWLPVNTPRLPRGRSPRSMALDVGGAAARSRRRVDLGALVGGGELVDQGMLGGQTAKVMPKLVSGRVVKTRNRLVVVPRRAGRTRRPRTVRSSCAAWS
jgi:hypothetical protein